MTNRNKIIIASSVIIIILASVGGLIYWNIVSARIYIENASVSAPVINLVPVVGGTLQEVYVNVGDLVSMSAPVARVGSELIKAKSDGQILSVSTSKGAGFGPGQAVATMINPNDLRVVGQAQEDKGLSQIKVGQTVIFTVDAFGGKQYSGIVDEISPTSNVGDIVFNISGTRQEMDFNVKVRFDKAQYLELKNGMSAKLWIYK
ncbi:MAG: HlyD family efflux transporter periplasmic adaptor subunit [Candidatus Staskawiczbacteria bacterium]|nr:HlyD family efflux transporter periplasmic adaptor subunit [Candidatus Staskawiczbacteria bacterium]